MQFDLRPAVAPTLSNLTATANIKSVTLRWDSSSSDTHAKTKIYWSQSSSNSALATELVEVEGNTYTHNLVPSGTTYYWVKSVNVFGRVDGAFSNMATVTVPLVQTADITNNAVTAGKTNIAAINSSTGALNANVVDVNSIMAGAVTALKLADGAVTANKTTIAAINSTTGQLMAGTVSATQIAADAVTSVKLAAGAVTAAKTAIAAINPASGNLVANCVAAVNIIAGSITANEIAASTITGAKIAANTIAAGHIVANTITAAQIAAGTITATEIAAGTITAAKMHAGYLYAGAINATQITAGTLSANFINGGTFSGASINIGSSAGGSVFSVTNNGTVVGYRKLSGYNIEAGNGAAPGDAAISATAAVASGGNAINATVEHTGSGGIGGYGLALLATNKGETGGSHAIRGTWNKYGTSTNPGRGVNNAAYSSGLVGVANGNAFYAEAGTVGPFTGSHEVAIEPGFEFEPGDIVIDDECLLRNGWSNTLFKIKRSSQANEAGAIGVITHNTGSMARVSLLAAAGTLTLDIETGVASGPEDFEAIKDEYDVAHANSLGEGQINVCGEGGNIAKGDLIVCSNMPGKGMRQMSFLMPLADGSTKEVQLVANYTVAKARESVTFDSPTQVKQVACTYHCG